MKKYIPFFILILTSQTQSMEKEINEEEHRLPIDPHLLALDRKRNSTSKLSEIKETDEYKELQSTINALEKNRENNIQEFMTQDGLSEKEATNKFCRIIYPLYLQRQILEHKHLNPGIEDYLPKKDRSVSGTTPETKNT